LFVTNQMGGGDVKLLTALALWFTPVSFIQLVILMAVLGGGASIAMAAFNMQRVPGERVRDVLAGVVALAWVWAACGLLFSLASRRPLIGPGTIDAVISVLPSVWALLLAAGAIGLIFVLGFTHIVRRQKSKLPIPYGIAIAAAGLWVLGEQTLFAARMAGQTG
jgi:prepilin peptidase CpaA